MRRDNDQPGEIPAYILRRIVFGVWLVTLFFIGAGAYHFLSR